MENFWKQKPWILISRIIFCVISLTGIILTVFNDQFIVSSLSYFTVQSNILGFVVMVILIIRMILNKPINSRGMLFVKGAATVALFLTFTVFHFALRPVMNNSDMQGYMSSAGNAIAHYVAPLWFFLDHFLFDEKGSYSRFDPLWFLLLPALYYVYVLIYGALGGWFHFEEEVSKYPYFFLDPNLMGGGWGVLMAIVIVLVMVTILGYGFYFLDRYVGKKLLKSDRKA